jgi:ABC-type nitrate/sulfonate/bicarbonate transport system permease component
VNATVHKNFLRVSSVLAGLLGWHCLAVFVIRDGGVLPSPLEVLEKGYEMTVVTESSIRTCSPAQSPSSPASACP